MRMHGWFTVLALASGLLVGCGSSVRRAPPEQEQGGGDGSSDYTSPDDPPDTRPDEPSGSCPGDVLDTPRIGFYGLVKDAQATVVSVFPDGTGLTLAGAVGEYEFHWPGADLDSYFVPGETVAIVSDEYQMGWQSVAGAYTAAVYLTSAFVLPSAIPESPAAGPSLDVGAYQCSQDDGSAFRLAAELEGDVVEIDLAQTEKIGGWQVTNVVVAEWPMIVFEDGSHAEGFAIFQAALLGPS